MKGLDTANPSWLFRDRKEPKEREKGNENFKFYYKYLRKQIKKIMEAKNELQISD